MSEDRLSISVQVRGRRVVVVGGGSAALRRVGRLLRAGALVEVVAWQVEAALDDLAQRGDISWHVRDLRAEDLQGAWLVVAATGSADQDAAVLRQADAASVWSIGPDHGALLAAPAVASPAVQDGASGLAPGSVTLVGGGPGDEGLLTVAGLRAVQGADVLVVDRLAPLTVLDGLGDHVEIIDVSKIPRGRATSQEAINAVLVQRARANRRVVRLKGGDPYVFGRGMEEVIACAEAEVPVFVVPGVTSAVAAPELAGIPVTHRGLSQGFTVVSGHVPPGDPRSAVDWAALAVAGTTLVVLMGVQTLPEIAAALLAGGMAPQTPVASVMDAGLPGQRTLTATVAGIVRDGCHPALRAPAVTVIGAVAALGERRPPGTR